MEPSLRVRVRAGDPDAFGELFDECAQGVYGLACRLTGSRADAEDVVSLTFLEAWRHRDRIDPGEGPVVPWLFGIAVNVARNLSRTARRHEAAMRRLPPPGSVPDFTDELAERIDLEKPHERQVWQSVSDLCTGLIREGGQDTSLAPAPSGVTSLAPAPSGVTCPQPGNVNAPTYRFLQSLPTDPQALLNLIYRKMQGQQPRPAEAFTTIGDMLHEAIVPPQVSAALYRAAAMIPGVTVVPDVTNALGRHGVGVAFEAQGERTEWVFDKRTFQYIGEHDINLADGSTSGASAVVERAFVNHIGQVPH